jgi:hypothetical protein
LVLRLVLPEDEGQKIGARAAAAVLFAAGDAGASSGGSGPPPVSPSSQGKGTGCARRRWWSQQWSQPEASCSGGSGPPPASPTSKGKGPAEAVDDRPPPQQQHNMAQCTICFVDHPVSEMINAGSDACGSSKMLPGCCGHIYCVDCMRQWVCSCIDGGKHLLLCPSPGCNLAIAHHDIARLLADKAPAHMEVSGKRFIFWCCCQDAKSAHQLHHIACLHVPCKRSATCDWAWRSPSHPRRASTAPTRSVLRC